MKKWIIVEDRPWVMEGFIQDIKQRAQEREQAYREPEILYYNEDDEGTGSATEDTYEANVKNFEQETGIQVKRFGSMHFVEYMDEYYKENYVIFMDLNLTGGKSMYFNERNNVQYAREKLLQSQKKGEQEKQIWFYTTGASLDASFLLSEFSDNVVEVSNFEDGKAYLDIDKSWEILCD